jgi:hypothetical protein
MKTVKFGILVLFVAALGFVVSCGKDDGDGSRFTVSIWKYEVILEIEGEIPGVGVSTANSDLNSVLGEDFSVFVGEYGFVDSDVRARVARFNSGFERIYTKSHLSDD